MEQDDLERERLTPETEPLPCKMDNDLVIVLNASSTTTRKDYEIALKFVSKLAYAWAGSPGNRVSVMKYPYGKGVYTRFPLNHNLSQQQIHGLTQPNALGYEGVETRVQEKALKEAILQHQNEK